MIKVLNIKDIIKYLVRLTIILIITVGITRYFSNLDIKETKIDFIKFNINISQLRKNLIKTNRKVIAQGLRDGIPIGLGYLAVSFSLGIAAKNAGLTAFQSFLASLL